MKINTNQNNNLWGEEKDKTQEELINNYAYKSAVVSVILVSSLAVWWLLLESQDDGTFSKIINNIIGSYALVDR